MVFDVAADSYDRFMGRYSGVLAPQLADLAGVEPGQRAIDVGCGPGVLTAELVARVGAESVAAVDPSAPFVGAAHERYPGVDVRQATAEALPFADDTFDVALAQLVVHFMTNPVAGLREMARVTRAGGVVAASVWDFGGDRDPLNIFWKAARDVDPGVEDESSLAGARQGELAQLFVAAGIREIVESELVVAVEHPTFEEWWSPFLLGVGPAGAYVRDLDPARLETLRDRCRELAPDPFRLDVVAWAARGLA